ncbi:MAG: NAD(P)-dependent oxidoreductase [Desulfatibacillaceae bacterium]|nr:NAD(P)-dependent oxidoreductase [Desulfatibacillaceae bacterium]
MKRVLVTGATGFIGRHTLGPLVQRGFEVHAVAGPGEAPVFDKATWHEADLLDEAQTQALVKRIAPSHLMHLAWYTDPADYRTSKKNRLWVDAGLGLARAFVGAGGRRALFAGSCFEYGPVHGPCHETKTPCRPDTIYGQAKHELFCRLAADLRPKDMSLAWARLFFVYGPGERHEKLIPTVINNLLQGRPTPLTQGSELADFVFVEDAALALVEILDGAATGPINVASGKPLTIRQIAEEIARQTGAVNCLKFGEYPLPAAQKILADTTRLAKEEGWKPATGLEEGIAKAIEFWLSVIGKSHAEKFMGAESHSRIAWELNEKLQ